MDDCLTGLKEEWMKLGRQLNISELQCELQYNKIKKWFQDAIVLKSENSGAHPAEIPKLKIEEESAFILKFNMFCSLQGETNSCSSPRIKESVFELQRRIHLEKDAQESVLFSPEMMEKIFRKLDLAGQNSFRLVCTQWYKMAHAYWVKSSFNCRENIELLMRINLDDLDGCFDILISFIKKWPLLKSVTCNLDDRGQNSEVIEAVLLYVEDLHNIELGYATLSQVKCLVRKYKNLKSVSLHVTSRNLVESVKCLGKCEKLEKLAFSTDGDSKDGRKEHNYPEVCSVIAENYLELKSLTLMPVVSLQMARQLEYLLRKRSTTFSKLDLVFHKYSNNIGNVLGFCTNLEILGLKLYSPDTPFHLSGLNELKVLIINFVGIYTHEVVSETLSSIQDKGFQTHLNYLCLIFSGSGVLRIPTLNTSNSVNLETCQLHAIDESTVMNELSGISNLNSLLYITIVGRYITENITRYIARCKSLRVLALERCTLTEPALLELKHCTSLKLLLLVNSELPLNGIIQSVKSLPNLKFYYLRKRGASTFNILRKCGFLRKE